MGSTISYSSGIDATNHSDSCSEENAEICTEVYIKGDSEVSFLFELQSNFFPAKIPFSKIQKKNLAGKKTLQMDEVLFYWIFEKHHKILGLPKSKHPDR
jgi:hypothetical protein